MLLSTHGTDSVSLHQARVTAAYGVPDALVLQCQPTGLCEEYDQL
jgi:hypothetical protein